MSQVNLLPREILQRQRYRRVSYLIGLAGAGVVALIFLFYLVQVGTLGSVQTDIDRQRQTNQGIETQIRALQEFEDLRTEAERKQELLAAAFAGEMSFSGILMDVSRLMPGTAFLQEMSIQTTMTTGAAEPAPEPTAGPGFVGAISFGGVSTDFDTVADLLTRLERVEGWVNPWAQSLADVANGVTFTTGVDLSPDVLTERGLEARDGG